MTLHLLWEVTAVFRHWLIKTSEQASRIPSPPQKRPDILTHLTEKWFAAIIIKHFWVSMTQFKTTENKKNKVPDIFRLWSKWQEVRTIWWGLLHPFLKADILAPRLLVWLELGDISTKIHSKTRSLWIWKEKKKSDPKNKTENIFF